MVEPQRGRRRSVITGASRACGDGRVARESCTIDDVLVVGERGIRSDVIPESTFEKNLRMSEDTAVRR